MPISASASAGASLMPSPTEASTLPPARISWIAFTLPSGSTSATTREMPTCRAIALAVRALSPVTMATSMPIACSALMAATLDGFSGSATAIAAASLPSMAA
ncbi:hypothetical protein D3C78_1511970 [compost metagenome]